MSEARSALRQARRVVIKLGSRSLVGASILAPAEEGAGRFETIAEAVDAQRREGRSVVVVSSGAVALGRRRLGFGDKPRVMAELQACAAVGQSLLMHSWERAFSVRDIPVAQMLLSHADLEDRARYLNARAALDALLSMGAVPIINENDTVAVDEIRFGDNDQLAAMVANLAGADLLVLFTDVEGLLDHDGQRVPEVIDAAIVTGLAGASTGDVGSGGMASKLDAARRAVRHGVPVVIASAKAEGGLARILAGEDIGTLFCSTGPRLASRKHWIAYTLRPRGDLLIDAGAVTALRRGGRSLLPAGIVGVRGSFSAGDPVVLRDPSGGEIGRGLSRYSTEDVAKLAGARTGEIEARLGYHGGDEVVHCDDLVLM